MEKKNIAFPSSGFEVFLHPVTDEDRCRLMNLTTRRPCVSGLDSRGSTQYLHGGPQPFRKTSRSPSTHTPVGGAASPIGRGSASGFKLPTIIIHDHWLRWWATVPDLTEPRRPKQKFLPFLLMEVSSFDLQKTSSATAEKAKRRLWLPSVYNTLTLRCTTCLHSG